jgi:peptidyl-prolyl cis-trans isomerase D
MLQLFRNFFKSTFGVGFTLVFLVVIAIAFGVGSVASSGTFGGVSGGDRVAVVGKHKVSTSDLSSALTTALENQRQQTPTLTMQAFIAGGGLDQTLDQLLQRVALSQFAEKNGLRAGKRLVDSELLKIQAFKGADGKFNQDLFLSTLRQRGLSEATVRDDIAAGLYARQTLLPADYGTTVPQSLAEQYAVLLKERRKGEIAVLPSVAYAPKDDPSDKVLGAYYTAHRTDYMRPERRTISYVSFGEDSIGKLPPPTDEQIAARYKRDEAQYAARNLRTFTQLVVPTEAAAKAVVDEVSGGKSLAAAATAKGLATTSVGPLDKPAFATQASQAVADAAFAAREGTIVPPAKGGLGWYVLRVDKVENRPGKTLDQVRGEIAATLADEQHKAAFVDLASKIEDQLDDGESLEGVAKGLNLQVQTTAPLTADGKVYGTQDSAPPVLGRALKTAFEMDQGQPQLAEIDPGKTYLVFEASQITASAAAPLKDIRDRVVFDWKRSEGDLAAKEAAQRILKAVQGGKTLEAAVAEEKVKLPPPDKVDMGRDELSKMQRVPSVLALMFSMAKGTEKRLEAPQDGGWWVVKLDDIVLPAVDKNDPVIASTQQQLASVFGDEYAEQMVRAAQRDVGVEKNQTAIDAVAKQLTGQAE